MIRLSHFLKRFHLAGAIGCAVAILITIAAARPIWAQGSGGATILFDPASVDVAAGQMVTLNIVLEDASEAYGIDLRASFDPALVEIVDADSAQDGVQMTPGAFLKPDFVVRNAADNTTGALRYVMTQVNPTLPATGSGVILSLQARGKAAGQAVFIVESVEMADRRGEALVVRPQNETVRLAPSPGIAPTLAPAPTSVVAPASTTVEPATSPAPSPVAARASPVPETHAPPRGSLLPSCGVGPAGGIILFGLVGWLRVRRRPSGE